MSEPTWLTEARKYIGQKEVPGPGENPWITDLWKKIKRGGIKTETVPWCAALVGAMLETVGITSTRFESAKSYLTWGIELDHPCVGAIVVFDRDGGGHVGFVVGQDRAGNVLVLGGNQGDAVNIRAFTASRVAGYRWPVGVPVPPAHDLPITAAEFSKSEA